MVYGGVIVEVKFRRLCGVCREMYCGVKLLLYKGMLCVFGFFFQAEDGIRDLVRSRGLGDVYKRQALGSISFLLILPLT